MTRQPTQTENNCPICGKPENEHKDGLFCCPFCGSKAKISQRIISMVTKRVGLYFYAECSECSCESAFVLHDPDDPMQGKSIQNEFNNLNKVKNLWNKRA